MINVSNLVDIVEPKNIEDLIGQKFIKNDLLNRSKTMEFSAVMLFEGNSGVGKTTASKIVSKLINCENPTLQQDGTHISCGKCESCLDTSYSRDIKFYDGSKMGKDDVNKLTSKLELSSLYDKNKIFIIDEAQELASAQAKGALMSLLDLKIPNTYIILNTMDIDKFGSPNTELRKAIEGRPQTYHFKIPTSDDISAFLYKVLTRFDWIKEVPEEFWTKTIFTISENVYGSVRKAIQVLERCLNSQIFTEAEVLDEFSFITEEKIFDILIRLCHRDKSVLADFQNIDLENFFEMSWKQIISALGYSLSNESLKNPKLENLYKNMNKLNNLPTLLNRYQKIQQMSTAYFSQYFYLSEIVLYLSEQNSIPYPKRG